MATAKVAPLGRACPALGGACANSPPTWPATPTGGSASAGNEYGRSCAGTESGFQRTRTWKTSNDPAVDTKLDRIDEVLTRFPHYFDFDQLGPLSIRPHHGSCWAPRTRPNRLPASYRRTHGIRYLHGCYSIGEDRLRGVNRHRKGGDQSLTVLKSIYAARPDGAPIYVIMDNLSADKTPGALKWATSHNVGIYLTPTHASWPTLSKRGSGLHGPSSSRTRTTPSTLSLPVNCNDTCVDTTPTRDTPDILAAQRRERARVRSEGHQCWGRAPTRTAT